MMGTPTNARTVGTNGFIPAELLTGLCNEEAEHLHNVCNRPDTTAIYVVDLDKGELFAYGVIGLADDGALAIYAANTFNSVMSKMALKTFLGVSEVLGKPLRVHADKADVMARYMGAESFTSAIHSDGVNWGSFNGGQ